MQLKQAVEVCWATEGTIADCDTALEVGVSAVAATAAAATIQLLHMVKLEL